MEKGGRREEAREQCHSFDGQDNLARNGFLPQQMTGLEQGLAENWQCLLVTVSNCPWKGGPLLDVNGISMSIKVNYAQRRLHYLERN